MFTGIIKQTRPVKSAKRRGGSLDLRVDFGDGAAGVGPGESVAISGVCLTVSRKEGNTLCFDVIEETLSRSTLGGLSASDIVNLELPLAVGDRLGGHFVQGHVDFTARVLGAAELESSRELRVELPPEHSKFIVEKGSIAVNGVSLTVARLDGASFTVALIPTTLRETNLGRLKAGELVNVELDILGKYAARPAAKDEPSSKITPEFLRERGFM